MLCDICKQNVATVHLTQMVEGKTKKVDLCEACSKEKGVDDPTGFSLADLLLGLGAAQEMAQAAAGAVLQTRGAARSHRDVQPCSAGPKPQGLFLSRLGQKGRPRQGSRGGPPGGRKPSADVCRVLRDDGQSQRHGQTNPGRAA